MGIMSVGERDVYKRQVLGVGDLEAHLDDAAGDEFEGLRPVTELVGGENVYLDLALGPLENLVGEPVARLVVIGVRRVGVTHLEGPLRCRRRGGPQRKHQGRHER